MNKLSDEKRAAVIGGLVEGNSINSTARMVGVSKPTILKLLADIGRACAEYHDTRVRGLQPRNVECDEVWSFCYAKAKNVPADKRGVFGYGDLWLWTGLDADSKLMIGWHVGLRTPGDAQEFMLDLAGRITSLCQISTDGLSVYVDAVYEAFGTHVDYAQLVKTFAAEPTNEARYSPPKCNGAQKKHVIGCPDPDRICTSHIERSNLTLRMSNRRYTRLTNAFSKKAENHIHAVALFMVHYNFCRGHKSLDGKTPAMAAGLADHRWTIEELVDLLG